MTIKKNIFNILTFFLVSHLIVWTAIPFFSNVNLPLDTIEALAWSSNLDWGYNKHPPLVQWLWKFFTKYLDLMIGHFIF